MKIFLTHVRDSIQGKLKFGDRRSSKWPEVRADHLNEFPTCAVCGGTKKLEVHHIKPFHLYHHLELDPHNLITLCESKRNGLNCHLAIGHLGDFKSWNASVRIDATRLKNKIESRPYTHPCSKR